MINKKIFVYRSFWHKEKANKRFADIGVRRICFCPANTLSGLGVPYSKYPSTWVGPGQYDFSSVDKQIADLQKANPGAQLFCMIDLNTPGWWVRLNASWNKDNADSFHDFGRVAASETWRGDTREYLQAFLKHTETHHAKVISHYHLNCGMTTEWQDSSMGEESTSRRLAWRNWMTGRGFADPVDIPPASVREQASHGIFRDPAHDATAINYWRFCAWLVGDAILYFAAAAQEVIKHRVPLGIFYGYCLEHGTGRLPYEGHLDFDRIFSSPLLDFFSAPGSYFDREVGGASGDMVCLGSLRHHHKGFIHEIDHRTHTSKKAAADLGMPAPEFFDIGILPDETATIAGLRREFVLALTNGISLWWFDMLGHWYDGKPVMDAIGQMRGIWERLAERDDEPAAEIAVIFDAESMFYVDGRAPMLDELFILQRYGLGRMGAPYEVFSFADLDALDLSRYKLVLLPNLFVLDDKKRKVLSEKVCTGGKTVLWIYAPGIITNGKYDPANVKKLTGVPFDAEKLATCEMDGWKSVFSPKPNLPAADLRRTARTAGVHLYCETEEPLYASSRLLAFHTSKGGKRKFRLPRKCKIVTELFSNRVVAKDTAEFEDTLSAPGTVLYELKGDR